MYAKYILDSSHVLRSYWMVLWNKAHHRLLFSISVHDLAKQIISALTPRPVALLLPHTFLPQSGLIAERLLPAQSIGVR